jgi:hypothetical protein
MSELTNRSENTAGGIDGVHYWLKIRDILTAESVNVVLQK